jgi:hypothetical protein
MPSISSKSWTYLLWTITYWFVFSPRTHQVVLVGQSDGDSRFWANANLQSGNIGILTNGNLQGGNVSIITNGNIQSGILTNGNQLNGILTNGNIQSGILTNSNQLNGILTNGAIFTSESHATSTSSSVSEPIPFIPRRTTSLRHYPKKSSPSVTRREVQQKVIASEPSKLSIERPGNTFKQIF